MSLRGILDNHKRVSIVPVVHAVPGREATGEKGQRIVAFQGGLRTLPPRVARFRERCCTNATRRYLPDEVARRERNEVRISCASVPLVDYGDGRGSAELLGIFGRDADERRQGLLAALMPSHRKFMLVFVHRLASQISSVVAVR